MLFVCQLLPTDFVTSALNPSESGDQKKKISKRSFKTVCGHNVYVLCGQNVNGFKQNFSTSHRLYRHRPDCLCMYVGSLLMTTNHKTGES